jgi:hypothetical protein
VTGGAVGGAFFPVRLKGLLAPKSGFSSVELAFFTGLPERVFASLPETEDKKITFALFCQQIII